MLEDVEEPMLGRPATLKDPGTPEQIVVGTAQSDTLSESSLVQDVRRISRIMIHRIDEQSKIDFSCASTGYNG